MKFSPTISIRPPTPARSDIRAEDLGTLADLQRNTRRLALQYPSNPVVCRNLTELRDFLLERFPIAAESGAQEPKPDPENVPDTSKKLGTRHCSICGHMRRDKIDAALRSGSSVRRVASDFQLSKSAVNRHHRHLEKLNDGPA